MDGPGWDRADWVRACYGALLGRRAESDAVVGFHAGNHASPADTLAAFVNSDEFRARQRREAGLRRLGSQPVAPVAGALRVLLFGAYGNGNLGDAAQPEAVAALLRAATGRPLDIRATSWQATDAFPYPPALLLGPDAILEPALLAGFDLLLLGGGGLFAPVHFPLLDPQFVDFLGRSGLPWGFFGLGVAQGISQDPATGQLWTRLVEGAAFRSARDEESRSRMAGALALPDPVLLAGLRAGGGRPRADIPGARPLCIVKRPAHASERDFLTAVAALGEAVDVVAVEPRQDAGQCPGLRCVTSMAELQALCAAASVVVSARYHGCIAALLAGVPCLGIGPSKSRALLQALGAGEQFLAHAGDLARHLAMPPAPLAEAAFAPLAAAADASLASLGAVLDTLPRRNGDTPRD